MKRVLFADYDLDANLRLATQTAIDAVQNIPEQSFILSSDDEIVEKIIAEHRAEPLTLYEDSATMTQEETLIDVSRDPTRYIRDRSRPFNVPGTLVTVSIPYTGAEGFWRSRTSTYDYNPPEASVLPARGNTMGCLILTSSLVHNEDTNKLKQWHDALMKSLRQYVQWSGVQVQASNSGLPAHIRAAIVDRRTRLQKHSGLADLLAIPLKAAPSSPSVKPVVLQRRSPPPLPVPPKTGLRPEPGITDQEYERVLSIIRHEGRSFETTPATFAGLGEESLRDVILAHLNGHYEGAATGETFRRSGKTDINIQVENRSAFIAECKVWRGQGEVADAIDQLLGYLTWRDSKAALIFFNTTVAGFSAIAPRFEEAIFAHKHFLKHLPSTDAGEARVVMRSAEDEGRRVTLHAFLFNLYVSDA
jgi:hypothetical protein